MSDRGATGSASSAATSRRVLAQGTLLPSRPVAVGGAREVDVQRLALQFEMLGVSYAVRIARALLVHGVDAASWTTAELASWLARQEHATLQRAYGLCPRSIGQIRFALDRWERVQPRDERRL